MSATIPPRIPPASPSQPTPTSLSGSGVFSPGLTPVVGRYELLIELAAGGMGAVYLGRQRGAAGFERLVAIKRMHKHLAASRELTAAFHDEARIASLIRHPNVVNVVDVYEEGGEHMLVMDYVEGVAVSTLQQSARRNDGKLPRPVALRIAIDAARGLHAAHTLTGLDGAPLAVVHRDVSPQNILVAVDGSVKLTDFGIARALQRLVQTATGELKGKVRYMSPEQALGRTVDHRSDVFALAVVLWELLVGDRMYQGQSDVELLHVAAQGAAPRPSLFDPTLPAALEQIVMRALAAAPSDRFQSAAAFAEALEQWAWQSGASGSSADVAATVARLAGDRIAQRRATALEIVQGRRAPEVRSPTAIRHGMTPGTSSLTAQTGQPQNAPRKGVWVALGIAVLGGGISAGVLIDARIREQKASSAATPSGVEPSSPLPPSATATAIVSAGPAEVVTVELTSSAPIVAVRGAGVSAVVFSDKGATFTLPRGDSPIDLTIEWADGKSEQRRVTPSANVALRAGMAQSSASAPPPPRPGGPLPPPANEKLRPAPVWK